MKAKGQDVKKWRDRVRIVPQCQKLIPPSINEQAEHAIYEGLLESHSLLWLTAVHFLVFLRKHVNVVKCGIAVHDFERLADLESQGMWDIDAGLLIESLLLGCRWELSTLEPLRDVDEGVDEFAADAEDHLL